MSPTDPRSLANRIGQDIAELTASIEASADESTIERIVGKNLRGLGKNNRPGPVISLALWADVMTVAEYAITADGRVSDAELTLAFPIAAQLAHRLARARKKTYEGFGALTPSATVDFIDLHMADDGPFGARCRTTAWQGLEVCHRASQLTHDPAPLAAYERIVLRVMDEIITLEGMSHEEAMVRKQLKDLVVRRRELEQTRDTTARDPRVDAFCAANAPEVFHAIAHAEQVFEPDPYDVDAIHAEARAAFARALLRSSDPDNHYGRSLLLLGRAGSGKTHLMRAFRSRVHHDRNGYVAYLQMASAAEDYGRYLLHNVIDSLERPYDPPAVQTSGLMCLSDALIRQPGLPHAEVASLLDEELDTDEAAFAVNTLVDRIVAMPSFARVDTDVISVLLYLQRRDPAIEARVSKWLRGEHLNAYERQLLGDIAPRPAEDAAPRLLAQLARVIGSTGGGALVLLVDQVEDLHAFEDAKARTRRALDVLRAVQDQAPNTVTALAFLDDFYTALRPFLTASVLDRLERDPDLVRLSDTRSAEEAEALVAPRLAHLFDRMQAPLRDDEPLFPFARADILRLAQLGNREILERCRLHQERCRAERAIVPFSSEAPGPAAPSTSQDWANELNDLRSSDALEWPQGEDGQAALIARVLELLGLSAAPDGRFVDFDLGDAPNLIAVSNKNTRGRGLLRQIDDARTRAGSKRLVLVRASSFGSGKKTAEALGEVVRQGGRRVSLNPTELRGMSAAVALAERSPEARGWLEGHLRRQEVLREMLGASSDGPLFEEATAASRSAEPEPLTESKDPSLPRPAASNPPEVSDSTPPPPRPVTTDGPFEIGETRALRPAPVELDPASLTTHAAFLGASGSGKTTFALQIIEQLLLQGTSVVMVDRKGDLATYADEQWWASPMQDEPRRARRAALRAGCDVRLYTPGDPKGSPLSLPVVPTGLSQLDTLERAKVARHASEALGAMMAYRGSQSERARVSILAKAIEVLADAEVEDVGLEALVDLIANQDASLVNAIGHLDTGHFRKLVDSLEMLRLQGEHLFAAGPRLDAGAFFGTGRPTLSIISTKFLGDNRSVEFWVSRLLVEVSRWASRNPSATLQGVLMLDEADIYLPAQSKPATKDPLQDLLRRARSAGLGVFLATQSPGDLDYRARDNIRSWFVGRVRERTAVEKMKPLLSECRIDVSGKLARCETGEFFQLSEGAVVELKAHRSVMDTVQLPEDRILELARASRPTP